MNKRAKVFYGDKLAGFISETGEGYTFLYDKEYLSNDQAKPVSLTLPLTTGAYLSRNLFPFFDGLIPEGWLLDIATKQWKIKAHERFELLLQTCHDTIGAITIIKEDDK